MLSEHGTQSKPDLPEDVMDYSTDRQIWTAAVVHRGAGQPAPRVPRADSTALIIGSWAGSRAQSAALTTGCVRGLRCASIAICQFPGQTTSSTPARASQRFASVRPTDLAASLPGVESMHYAGGKR